ncbi:MAG: DUF1491 family protein [Sphingomonadaceae bacterium]
MSNRKNLSTFSENALAMMDERLPAHLEISGLIRAAAAQGGFGTVIAKGERDAGTILIVTVERDNPARIWERMPAMDGTRKWTETKRQDPEKPQEFDDYLTRRQRQDDDLWIVELELPDLRRFAALQQNWVDLPEETPIWPPT